MIEENFIMLLVAGAGLAMVLMSLATRVGECSLLGLIFVAFGVPVTCQSYFSNLFWGRAIGTPMLLLGLTLIASDWFEKYEWIEIILGIPSEHRWKNRNQDSTENVRETEN